MKNLHIYILFLISLAVLLSLQNTKRIEIDGIGGEIGNLLLRTDTEYSENYSHEGFSQIEIGMTEEEVIYTLGEPLTRWKPYKYTNFREKQHFVGLQYSESPSDTHYRIRQIYLDNGIVQEVIGRFYID